MVQGHSSDPKMSRCRATPVEHNGASERSELAPLWSTGEALHRDILGSLEWPCTIRYSRGSVQGHVPARSRFWPCTQDLEGGMNGGGMLRFFQPCAGRLLSGKVLHMIQGVDWKVLLVYVGRPPTDAKGGYGPNRRKPRIWPH